MATLSQFGLSENFKTPASSFWKHYFFNFCIKVSMFLLALNCSSVVAQQDASDSLIITCECIFDWGETTGPTFPGGQEELIRFIEMSAVYPQEALRNREQGTVYVQFKVDSQGNISEIKVVKGVSYSLDEEAIHIVRSMPKWIPGKQAGKRINVRVELPIKFQLI